MKGALIRLDLRQRVINAAGKLIHVSQVTGAQPSSIDTARAHLKAAENKQGNARQADK